MKLNGFVEHFNPIRNTFELCSPLENMMFEKEEENQLEFVESKHPQYVWSYEETGILVNGIHYSPKVIGYLVCTVPCTFQRGTLKIKI